MVHNDDKKKFLEELCDIPIVSVVCKRVNISKATIYRWKKEDKEFAKHMEETLSVGRHTVNDLAESKLINLIKKESIQAIRFWLEGNDKRYYKPRKAIEAPPIQRTFTTMKIQIVQPTDTETDITEIVASPIRAMTVTWLPCLLSISNLEYVDALPRMTVSKSDGVVVAKLK
jgi:hypothetical protein